MCTQCSVSPARVAPKMRRGHSSFPSWQRSCPPRKPWLNVGQEKLVPAEITGNYHPWLCFWGHTDEPTPSTPQALAASRAGAGGTRVGRGTREPRGAAGQQQDWPSSQPPPPPANPSRANPSPHGHGSTWPLQPHLGEGKPSWGSSGCDKKTQTENPTGGWRERKNIHGGKIPTLRGARAGVGLVPLNPLEQQPPALFIYPGTRCTGKSPAPSFYN